MLSIWNPNGLDRLLKDVGGREEAERSARDGAFPYGATLAVIFHAFLTAVKTGPGRGSKRVCL